MHNSARLYIKAMVIATGLISFTIPMHAMFSMFSDCGERYKGTPLHYAAQSRNIKEVQQLLDAGENPNALDTFGHTPFYYACTYDALQDEVLQAQAKTIIRMLYLAQSDDLSLNPAYLSDEILTILVSIDREPYARAQLKHDHPLKLRSSIRSNEKDSVILKAAFHNNMRQALEALYAGANVEIRDEDDITPLHNAATTAFTPMTQLLLNCKASLEPKQKYGWTPLHYAAMQGNPLVVELLLARKADIEARDNDDHTPLHHAAQYDCEETIHALLNNNADTEARTKKGRTALDIAIKHGKPKIARIIEVYRSIVTDF